MTEEPAEIAGLVWSAGVDDGAWRADVTRMETNSWRGILTVTRIADGKEILREEVGLAYAAALGPDQSDVNLWGQMVIGSIDFYEAQHPEERT